MGLLRLLKRARALRQKGLSALALVLGEGERGFRFRDLQRSLLDHRLLGDGLRVGRGHRGFRLRDLRLRLILRGAEIPVVEPRQKLSGLDDLVVGDGDLDNGRRNLGAHGRRPSVNKRVVCGRVIARIERIDNASDYRCDGGDRDQDGDKPMAADPGPWVRRRSLIGGLFGVLIPSGRL